MALATRSRPIGSSRRKISEYMSGLGWTSRTRMAPSLLRGGSRRSVCRARDVGERERADDAGVGTQGGRHDVRLDVGHHLPGADVAGEQLDDASADARHERLLLEHAAAEDDTPR